MKNFRLLFFHVNISLKWPKDDVKLRLTANQKGQNVSNILKYNFQCSQVIFISVTLEGLKFPEVSIKGVVLVTGAGDVGQLGLGPDVLEKSRPAAVNIEHEVVDICAGGMHTVCLTAEGKVTFIRMMNLFICLQYIQYLR